DTILVIYKDGSYELTNFELTNVYEVNQIALLEKFDPETVISAVHYDGENRTTYVKRFRIETSTVSKRFSFINDAKASSKLLAVSTHATPKAELKFKRERNGEKENESIILSDFIDVKGWKAIGNKLAYYKIYTIDVNQKPEPQFQSGKKNSRVKEVKPLVSSPAAKPAATTSSVDTAEIVQPDVLELVQSDVRANADGTPKKEKKQLNLF
ncbi:MAG: DNA gyrase/topoisomerase IV subunit A, partial [Hymenobacteraceae bacterium]|nr:DNA gyrase/topoisomerase IV subunit A [Hymenobacteraceae bacterium]